MTEPSGLIRRRLNQYTLNISTNNNNNEEDDNNNNNLQSLKLNVLLVGEKGAGKSSLLSTFHRSLRQNYGEMPVSGVGMRSTQAFTRKKKGYVLNERGTIIGHDTRGLETFMETELEHIRAIRDGRVADDVEISQKKKWDTWDFMYSLVTRNPAAILDPSCLREPSESTMIHHLPHAVIFVVPANQRHVPAELAQFVELFTNYGYRPLFAVTKIDCHGGPSGDLYAATRLYDIKKQALLREFDLNYDEVLPIQNYTQWEKRESSVESLALDLLKRAVDHGEEFVANFIRENGEYVNQNRFFGTKLLSGLSANCTIS